MSSGLQHGATTPSIHSNIRIFYSYDFLLQYCVEDETLLDEARNCNPSNATMVIFDARSMLAAGGNRLKVNICLATFCLNRKKRSVIAVGKNRLKVPFFLTSLLFSHLSPPIDLLSLPVLEV